MDEFQTATEQFLAWFKSVGGEFRDDLLEIKDLRARDAGRGIIAIKDIPQETTLFTIPRDAIVNVQTSELVNKLPNVFDGPSDDEDEDAEPLDSWGSLILVMLYEYLQGDKSRWKPYFNVLPHVFDTPIFWTEAELKELEGTCLTPEKIGKDESDEMLRSRILPVVLQNPDVFYLDGAAQLAEDELLRLAHRMGSTIMAYAFDLDNENEESDDEDEGWVEDREGKTLLGMVPMADILNANADFNAHVNHGECLEVNALRANLPTGSEVLNYYGPLPSSELLRRYGYVTQEHRRYDVIELPWDHIQTALAEELQVSNEVLDKIQEKIDPEEFEEYFIFERDSGEPDSEGQLTYDAKIREIPPELEEQLKSFLKALKKSQPEIFSDKRKREEIFNTSIAKALKAKLSAYPTSVSEDEALLKGKDISKRHRMAIEVRLGEKILLNEAIEFLEQSATTSDETNGEPPAKRSRSKA